ncbi:MAG: laminarinase, glycosyl hydrolase family 16 er [Herbinix sp.]|nr:laminarinase, glycosyl hydrolase family 16 er [Herbinix sp.]
MGSIKRYKCFMITAVAILPCILFSACQDNNDGYRTGKKVSDAYVNPDAVATVAEEDIKAVGYVYDYEKLNYDLVWSDEFDYEGLPDDTKWNYDIGGSGWGNHELQYYTDDKNAYVKEGNLVIEARKEEYQGMDYTSARLVTRDKGDWLYGKIEVRAKLPDGLGTWPAIWMLSTDWKYGSWPASGEIDIMEHVGYNQDTIHASIHTQSYYHRINTQKTATKVIPGVSEEFHVYSIEWLPDKIIAYIDEEQYFSFTPSEFKKQPTYKEWPFDKRMHLLLNLAVGGDWGGAQGVDDSIYPKQMLVDYVRVYQSKEINEFTQK